MKIIYAEDNQMYYTNYYFVDTNYAGDLEMLSWSPVSAGRFSTSIGTLKCLVEETGCKFKILKNLGKVLPQKYLKFDIVKGATGNY